MAQGPESRYRAAVHKHIDKTEIYIEGMAKSFSRGTPDTYYEGRLGALWVEWKYLVLPKRDNTLISIGKLLSPVQFKWLERAFYNDVRVAVIVGTNLGGGFYSDDITDWLPGIVHSKEAFEKKLLTRKELAEKIDDVVTNS